ncbi:MBL fold metallo-hydrolase [Microbacterium sp. A93]|uniref:MBL fold metallo-hydrolase n=1 Tax=Microbacterium sp. A93 TaxID=3450716 RepID=UPI003F41EAFF
MSTIQLTLIGGPTALLTYAGYTFLTDPTFDAPGDHESPAGTLQKTLGPAIAVADLPTIDAILLSHDEHADNLDDAGRALVESGSVPVLGNPASAARVPTMTGLVTGEQHTLTAPGRDPVTITAVPARHGPEGCEPYTGPVTGFILSSDSTPTVYISGDNASLEAVEQVAADFGPVDVAVLFAGAARLGIFDNAPLTFTGPMAAEAARILQARVAAPLHADSWKHLSEGVEDVTRAFAEAGLQDVLRVPEPGAPLEL